MPAPILALIAAAGFCMPDQPAPTAPGAPKTGAAQPSGEKPKPMVLAKSIEKWLAERIARQLVAASPVVAPGDLKARDEAAERLGAMSDLVDAADNRILWGGFNPDQGYDPAAYRLDDISNPEHFQLTEFNPAIWAKMYLSTFMFPGPYQIRQEGRFTVLEIEAKFRGELDPGEYPYPFWHSPNKWTAYMNTQSLVFIFEPGRLLAAMRKSPPPQSLKQIRRTWDTKWTWTDAQGNPQPRVALFTYVFSKDNPHVGALDESFRELEKHFREQNCLLCHSPDNRSRLNDLLLLNYPNQALVARRTLVTVLESNNMPPGSVEAHEPMGIQDQKVLAEMIRLAKTFEKNADAAFAYERAHRDTTPPAPPAPPAPPGPPGAPGAKKN